MSRFIRLEERKNRIKATSCALALALVIGSAQSLGTYALFTDTEDLASNIAISTGDVDIEITEGKDGFHETDVQPSKTINYQFKVTNNGTLRQNLELKLDTNTIPNELKEIISYIDYNIKFKDGNFIKGLESGEFKNVINTDGSLLILNPGESITLTAEVIISKNMPNTTQIKLQGKVIPLNFKVKATQINESGTSISTGFYDICEQNNDLIIGALILQAGDAIKITPADDIDKAKDLTIEFFSGNNYIGLRDIVDILDGGLSTNLSSKNIKSVGQSGAFKDCKFTVNDSKGIKLLSPIYGNNILQDFGKGHYIDIQVDYGKGIYRVYRIDFRAIPKTDTTGNRLAQAQVTDVTKDYPTMSKDNIILEDIVLQEKPVEPEVVEPPKEEVEEPNQPEIIEPPKEEVVVPSQTDIIEPSKEEIEIQE